MEAIGEVTLGLSLMSLGFCRIMRMVLLVSMLSSSWPHACKVGQANSLSAVVMNSEIRSLGMQICGYLGLPVLVLFSLAAVVNASALAVDGTMVGLADDTATCVYGTWMSNLLI